MPPASSPVHTPWRLIGMVHLSPLPGAPLARAGMHDIRRRAVEDAVTLAEAGFDAVLVENYGDAPFHKDRVEPSVVAAMTAIVAEVRRAIAIPIGVQVLRNDAEAALAIAAATGAAFIRVNVHVGAMLTDQGVIEGRADATLRTRAVLGADVRILSDVLVKHAMPLVPTSIGSAAREAVDRGLADGIVVSGPGTGEAVSEEDLRMAAASVAVPVFVGSGASSGTVRHLLSIASGVIVGSSIKVDGRAASPVDPSRARDFVRAAG